MKRFFSVFLALLALGASLGASLAGCSQGQPAEKPSDGKPTQIDKSKQADREAAAKDNGG